jgi:putative membrane protein
MSRLDQLFLAFHLFGVILWVGGLFALTLFLAAIQKEPESASRTRLAAFVRKIAMLPDIGATIAIVFGAHWLFRFKLYTAHYMHAKLLLVAILIGLHGYLRVKTKRAAGGGDPSLPVFVRPAFALVVLGILIFVMLKIPA